MCVLCSLASCCFGFFFSNTHSKGILDVVIKYYKETYYWKLKTHSEGMTSAITGRDLILYHITLLPGCNLQSDFFYDCTVTIL